MILLLTSLQSDIDLTVWFDLGIINVGDAHSDDGHFFKTPKSTNLVTSFFRVS